MIRQPMESLEEWTIELDDSFEKVGEHILDDWLAAPGGEFESGFHGPLPRLFQAPGRTVSAQFTIAQGSLAGDSKSSALEEGLKFYMGRFDLAVVEATHERRLEDFLARAFLIPAHPARNHWCLYTFNSASNSTAQVIFSFPNRDDLAWALAAWQSIEYFPSRVTRFLNEHPALNEFWRDLRCGSGGRHSVIQHIKRENLTGSAVELAALTLREWDPRVRASACCALDSLADPACLPLLREMLGDPDAMVRMRAADALCGFNEPEASLIPMLLSALIQPEPPAESADESTSSRPFRTGGEARYHAARILGYLGAEAEPAREALRETLASPSGITRSAAALALAQLKEPPETYLPPLYQAMHDTKCQAPRERGWVAETLWKLGRPPSDVLPVLIELANHPDWLPCGYALGTLQQMGAAAAPAIPALRIALKSEREAVARTAAEVLRHIEQEMQKVSTSPKDSHQR